MLDTLDILIGFTVVMLIVSMPVTMITQFVSEIFNLRGQALLSGVTSLLGLLDKAELPRAIAKPIAVRLLSDPLIAKQGLVRPRKAGTVLREELAKLILRFAADANKPLQDERIAAGQKLQDAEESRRVAAAAIVQAQDIKEKAEANLSAAMNTADAAALATAKKELTSASDAHTIATTALAAADNVLAKAKVQVFDAAAALRAPGSRSHIVALQTEKLAADRALKAAESARPTDQTALHAAKARVFDAAEARRAPGSRNDLVAGVLYDLGIDDPASVLKSVRDTQLELEQSAPELANDVRASMAMLKHASSDFLAKFNGWFDQTMDRVSETFTLYSRVVTLFVALLVAIVLQLDSVSLINRLSADKQIRDALVQSAIKDPERFDPQPSPAAAKKRAEADLATRTKEKEGNYIPCKPALIEA